ncbi:PGAP1-like protein [Alloalcanivorax dieselolei B5]|uniref:PGAP1-like protein n=1 Tax=Alcanivorax dieselolei (strain DSM 16502 / CGMCC 1.3690 / MCCC 1A00001 / B-5) TaxID=930169 RepID=K0CJA6_ALCDB|nr:alpha/beta fold hydrolase [Alloalcanivorax dieselolei]AFT72505.1 PGAP1-like protein [Alloalcanivorax dieselolei B5]GGJ78303.1 hypothetical protein GCM10007426_04300 [Alloalcanivorax dieselolei]
MKRIGRQLGGLTQLITAMGSEITQVVQDMHGAIANPLGWRGADYVPAPRIYGAVRLGLRHAGDVAALGALAADPYRRVSYLDLQSVLNGVFGQLLSAQRSHYALPMTLHPARPEPERDTLVLYLHGLCMNESCWRHTAQQRFNQRLESTFNADIAYLRYNTGRHISDNGARLSRLLEHTPLPPRLILIGHSMGGLLARSAVHHARQHGHRWVERVSHLACLGAPHQGALLEQVGNQANRLLAVTPYSRPLMRLGNLRSDGIRDLRFGYVVEEQWQGLPEDAPRPGSKVPLDDHIEHLFLAGTLSEHRTPAPLGDWLVGVDSALARRLYPDAPQLTRAQFHGMGHMAMLGDARTYRALSDWLAL